MLPKRWLLAPAAVLMLAILFLGIILGPLGLSAYVGGLLNFTPLGTALATLAGWLCLLVYGIKRLVIARRGMGATATRAILFWASVVGSIVASFVLLSVGVHPIAMHLYARGFETHVEIRTDIDVIQAWVQTLDPNDYVGEPIEHIPRALNQVDQPMAIARLHTRVRLELDEAGRPRVRLIWDASKFGLWGLVVGDENMETPASDPGMYGQYTRELRKGIYFWSRERP